MVADAEHRAAASGWRGGGNYCPGVPLTRNDGLQQSCGANYLTAAHYLDCWGTSGCNVEDNANFVNGSAGNGFIMGPIRPMVAMWSTIG